MKKLTPYLKAATNIIAEPHNGILVKFGALIATDGKRSMSKPSTLVTGNGFIIPPYIKILTAYEEIGEILRVRVDAHRLEVFVNLAPNMFETINLSTYPAPCVKPYYLITPALQRIRWAAQCVPTKTLLDIESAEYVSFDKARRVFYPTDQGAAPAYSMSDIKDGLPVFGETLDVFTNDENYLVLKSRDVWYAIPPIE